MATAPDPRSVSAQLRADSVKNYRKVGKLDGKEFTFRLGELTSLDVMALRKATGLTVTDMVQNVWYPTDNWDAVIAIVWLARRQAGETDLSYEDVAFWTPLEAVFEMDDVDAPEWTGEEIEESGPAEEDDPFPDPPPSGGD